MMQPNREIEHGTVSIVGHHHDSFDPDNHMYTVDYLRFLKAIHKEKEKYCR